jgi:hypothetical protein
MDCVTTVWRAGGGGGGGLRAPHGGSGTSSGSTGASATAKGKGTGKAKGKGKSKKAKGSEQAPPPAPPPQQQQVQPPPQQVRPQQPATESHGVSRYAVAAPLDTAVTWPIGGIKFCDAAACTGVTKVIAISLYGSDSRCVSRDVRCAGGTRTTGQPEGHRRDAGARELLHADLVFTRQQRRSARHFVSRPSAHGPCRSSTPMPHTTPAGGGRWFEL